MGNFLSYAMAVLVSIAVHVLVVGALLINWQPETERVMMQPQFIEATLIELAPKKKPQEKKPAAKTPAKPKVDLAKKKREADKRRAAQKKKAIALKKKQEQALKSWKKSVQPKPSADVLKPSLLKLWPRKRRRLMPKRMIASPIAIGSLFSSDCRRTGAGRPVLGAIWRR